MKQFAKLILNLLPSECRVDTLEGKDYTVVPMVILTEGVHIGSQGPLLYPKDELSKTPVVWNHKPIVVYHPTMNGEGVSACDPNIINSRKIGLMLNTKFEKGRLKSEAWIDAARADEIDERITAALNSKEMMELSTGVFIDVEQTSGKWKTEAYDGIARNYRPDHLALLPDQIGACSIADGAGLLRNMATNDTKLSKDVLQLLVKADLVEDKKVASVYSNFVVYEKDNRLWRLGFTFNEKGVELSDETPVEVERVAEYRTVQGALVGNEDTSKKPDQNMKTIKEKVDGIIAANAGWAETDREALMKFNDPQLTLIENSLKKPEPAAPPAAPAAPVAPLPPPVVNQQPITAQQYVQQAPREIQEVLTNGLQVYNEEKVKLVDCILANANNGFTKEDLNNKPLGELRNLARLAAAGSTAPATVAHYAGMAPTANTAPVEEALAVPSMNFDKKAA